MDIPYYKDASLAAGNGCINHDCEIEAITVSKKLIKGVASYKNLEAVNISGNSMTPYINHGDVVIIQKDATVIDGLVYAFRHGDSFFCKRIGIDPTTGEIHMMSDNPTIKGFSVRDVDLENLHIIGRVVGRFGEII